MIKKESGWEALKKRASQVNFEEDGWDALKKRSSSVTSWDKLDNEIATRKEREEKQKEREARLARNAQYTESLRRQSDTQYRRETRDPQLSQYRIDAEARDLALQQLLSQTPTMPSLPSRTDRESREGLNARANGELAYQSRLAMPMQNYTQKQNQLDETVEKIGGADRVNALLQEQAQEAANDRQYAAQLRGNDPSGLSTLQRAGRTGLNVLSAAVKQSSAAYGGIGANLAAFATPENISEEARNNIQTAARNYIMTMRDPGASRAVTEEQRNMTMDVLRANAGDDFANNALNYLQTYVSENRQDDPYEYLMSRFTDREANAANDWYQRGLQERLEGLQRVRESSAEDVQRAKDYNPIQSQFGDWLVDAGVSTVQSAMDAAGSAALGLSGGGVAALLPFALRAYGGSAGEAMQEMRERGQTIGRDAAKKAALYGAASSAIEVGTEMMWGIVGAASQVTGGGALDEFATRKVVDALSGLAKTKGGAKVLSRIGELVVGASTEGLEEVISDLLNNALNTAGIYGKEREALNLNEIIDSFVTGALSGVLGETTRGVSNRIGTEQVGNAVLNNQAGISYQKLYDIASGMNENRDAASNDASEMLKAFDRVERSGGSESAMNAGRLYNAFIDYQESAERGEAAAEKAIQKAEEGKKITSRDLNRILQSDTAVDMIQDMTGYEISGESLAERRDAIDAALEALASRRNASEMLDAQNSVELAENPQNRPSSPLRNIRNGGEDVYLRGIETAAQEQAARVPTQLERNRIAAPYGSTTPADATMNWEDRINYNRGQQALQTMQNFVSVRDAAGRMGINEQGQETFAGMYDGKQEPVQYTGEMARFYNQGIENRDFDINELGKTSLTAEQANAAYIAGRQDYLGKENTNERAEQAEQSGLRVRAGSEWNDGQNTGAESSEMAPVTGRAQTGEEGFVSGKSGIQRIRKESLNRESLSQIGLRDETDSRNPEIRAARDYAESHGLRFVAFSGGNLHFDGEKYGARGFYQPGRNGAPGTVYARTDHQMIKVGSIIRHEVTHAEIGNGRINIGSARGESTAVEFSTLRDALVRSLPGGVDEFNAMLDKYVEAYADTGESIEGIWEELVCDAVGGMNELLYQGHREDALKIAPTMQRVKDAAESMRTADTAGASPTIGRSSIDFDPSTHTEQERKRYEEYLSSVDQNLLRFVEKYYNNPSSKEFERYRISDVSDREAFLLKELTGKDYSDYSNSITSQNVHHIDKRHGNGETRHDATMQFPEDVARVGYVLSNPDDCEYVYDEHGILKTTGAFSGSDGKASPIIQFTRKIDGVYAVTLAVADNRYKNLWILNTFTANSRSAITRASNADFSTLKQTPEAEPVSLALSKQSVTERTEAVKENLSEALDKFGDSGEYNSEAGGSFSREMNPDTLRKLNSGKTMTVYRSMQLIDGKLYPPMAAKVKGKMVDAAELGAWYVSDERPDAINRVDSRGIGWFTLDKANGDSLEAAYNPYWHTSNLMINDQFTSAYKRENLVTVECEIPVNELSSGYKAEYAKDPVGKTDWHKGPVAGKLAKTGNPRTVYLSRWVKVKRVVSDAEVARNIAGYLAGTSITVPVNTVTPSLRSELEKLGVPISKVSGKIGAADAERLNASLTSEAYMPRTKEEAVSRYDGSDAAYGIDQDGHKFSLDSMERDILEGKFQNDLKNKLGWGKDRVTALVSSLDSLMKYIKPNRDILDLNEDYTKDNRPYSPYKPNSDPLYKISLDYSTLCRKRLMTQYIIEKLQLREHRPMSGEEQIAIRDMLQEYRQIENGLQVACAMCYVEAARLKSPDQMNRYFDDPEPVLRNYFAQKNKAYKRKVETAQKKWKTDHGYAADATKEKMTPADVNAFNEFSSKLRHDYDPAKDQADTKRRAEELAAIERAKTLSPDNYLSAANLAELKENEQLIYEAYTSNIRAATRSKGLETDVPYYYGDSRKKGGPSDKFIQNVNRENGMRFSSWSDFQFVHLLDQMMATIDLAVRKAAMHGYTKFPEQVRIFGKTGAMFNMSGVSGGTGFNEDGSLYFHPTESIDVEEAKRLRDQFPDTAGLQCIGINDKHVRALLQSDFIDYVIPYHVSGLNAVLRGMAKISSWTDYTASQEESVLDKNAKWEDSARRCPKDKWHKAPVFSEFFDKSWYTDPAYKGKGVEAMREATRRYLQLCEDRGMRPKFTQFLNEDNYWKLLIDRKMVNQKTGDLIQQRPVTPDFDLDVIKREIDQYVAKTRAEQGIEDRAYDYIIENLDQLPERITALKQEGAVQKNIAEAEKREAKMREVEHRANVLGNEMYAAHPKNAAAYKYSKELNYDRLLMKDGDLSPEEITAKKDYRTYLTDEAKEWYSKSARFQDWKHRDLAYISAASVAGAKIPYEILKEIPEIVEAEARARRSGSTSANITDSEQDGFVARLFDSEHGSATWDEKKNKIKKGSDGKELFRGPVATNREAFIVIGRPAGGKSRVFANPLSHEYNARIIDSDVVKPWIDGFDDGYGAGFVQNASAQTAEKALEEAIRRGENIVIPRVGGNSILRTASDLKKRGYRVSLYFNEVSEETSLMRAASRFAEEGRFLSLVYLTSIGEKATKVFVENAENRELFDHSEWRSNDVEFGKEPIEIFNSDRTGKSVRRVWEERMAREMGDTGSVNEEPSGRGGVRVSASGSESGIRTMEEGEPWGNQVKSSRELGTTELAEQNRQLRKDLSELRQQLMQKTASRDYWRGQTKVTEGRRLRVDDVTRLAREVVKGQDSTADVASISAKMKELGEYILNAQGTDDDLYGEARTRAYTIAHEILDQAKVLRETGGEDFYDDFKDYLKKTKIFVPGDIRSDVSNGEDWNAFKKSMKGINFGADGIGIDVAYKELQERFGEWLLPAASNKADMMKNIIRAYETYRPVYEHINSWDMADAVEYTANEIMTRIISDEIRETQPTYADRMTQKLADQKAKTQEALRRVRAQRDQTVANLKQHYQEVAQANRERKADSEARTKLLNIARRLNNKKLDRVSRALLDQYIGDLDLVAKGITGKTIRDLENLQKWYDAYKEKMGDDFIPDKFIETRLKRLSGRHINEMSQEEVADLTTILRNFENMVRTENELIESKIKADTYAAGLQTIEDIRNSDPRTGFLNKYISTETATPEREIRRITGYKENDPLYIAVKELSDGQRKMLDYQRRAEKIFKAWTANKKFTDSISGKKAKLVTIKGLIDGELKEIQITPAMRMALYLHEMNDDNMTHISKGGVKIPDMNLYKQGKVKEAYEKAERVVFTRSMLKAIASEMAPEERAFADAINRYYNGMSRDAINEVSELLKGYSLAGVENYYPIDTDGSFLKKEFDALKHDGTLEGMGILKERISGASTPIMLYDVNDTLSRSISQHSKYYGLAIPVRNFNKLYGVTTFKDREIDYQQDPFDRRDWEYDTSVQEALKRNWGDAATRYIEKMMTDVQNGTGLKQDVWGQMLARARSHYAGAVLTTNASVALKQAASYPTAAAVVGYGPLAKALADTGKIDLEKFAEYTPLLWYRSKGFSTAELGDIGKEGGHIPKALNWIQAIDIATTQKLVKAAMYYVNQTNKELVKDSDAWYKEVSKVYNRIIEETQPNYTMMQRPQILRSDSDLTRALNMFKTQPFQNFNILYDSFGNLAAKSRQYKASATEENLQALKEARKSAARAVSSQALSAFVFGLMQFAWDAFRGKLKKYKDDDDEMTFASWLKGMGINVLSSVGGMIPFGGYALELGEAMTDAISKSFGGGAIFDQTFYGLSENSADAFNDMGNALISLVTKTADVLSGDKLNETRIRGIIDSAADIAQFAGIPASNVIKTAQAIARNVFLATDGKWVGGYKALRVTTDPEKYKSDYYDLLYKAYRIDTAAYQQIREQMLKSDAFTEEKIRDAMRDREKKKAVNEEFYKQSYGELTSSSIWAQATAKQQKTATDNLMQIALQMKGLGNSTGESLQEKVSGGAQYGLEPSEYLLFRLALQMADSDQNGSYKQAETEDAIRMLTDLSDEERAYLFSLQHPNSKNNPWK